MNTGNLTDDQKSKIIGRSKEAQHFVNSPLYLELKEWIRQEKESIMRDIAFDNRGAGETGLTRDQFVERRSAYWLLLDTPIAVINKWASDEAQLTAILDEVKEDGGA